MKQHVFYQGERYLSPGEPLQLWQPGKVNSLTWQVIFDETIRYHQPGEDQFDWLKGGGISFDVFTNHKNSIMWGFRYNPNKDKIEFNLYMHINRLATYTKPIFEASIDQMVTIKIIRGNGYEWILKFSSKDGEKQIIGNIPTRSWLYRRIVAYFGGTLAAPQDVNMFFDFNKK